MSSSQLSPIIGSPAAPQQPPGGTSQLPSVKARLKPDKAAGGPGAVTGVTVQVLEGEEDEKPPTQGDVPSQRDRDQPPPGESAISDLRQEMPARDSDRSDPGQETGSPSTAQWKQVRRAAQASYVIQRLALGPGPFAQHSPSAPSLVEARSPSARSPSSSSSLLEASQPPQAQPATGDGPAALHSSRVSTALASETRPYSNLVETLKHSTPASSFDGPSAIPKEEMQQRALARNAAAGPCAQHSPNSSPGSTPDSRALEALGRSSLAPSSSSLAPRPRSSPTAGAKKPAAGPPKKKPAKGPAKAGPVKRLDPPKKAPRAMGHQMSATEGKEEDSEEEEDQGGGDFD